MYPSFASRVLGLQPGLCASVLSWLQGAAGPRRASCWPLTSCEKGECLGAAWAPVPLRRAPWPHHPSPAPPVPPRRPHDLTIPPPPPVPPRRPHGLTIPPSWLTRRWGLPCEIQPAPWPLSSEAAGRARACRPSEAERWLLPWASIGHSTPTLSSAFRAAAPPPCDVGTGQESRWRLRYDVYQYFLPEGDLTEASLLQYLQRMAQVPHVKASAAKVVTLTADDKTAVSFSSLPGQGVIYNVIVWDPSFNTSAAYVPAHTYACSFESADGGSCASPGRISTKVFSTLFALLGLFVCFFGHRFWKTELFFVGFIFLGFFFYILITRLTFLKYDVRLGLTAVAGSVGGILLVAAWWRFGTVTLCMLCVGLVLGFLVSSAVLFTPLGNLTVFRDDGVFWVTLSCVALLIPLVFMGCLRILNILACGVVGAYSVVLAVGSYVSTSLSYITLNVLRRALDVDFRGAVIRAPFQTNDFVILATWGMLAVSGITLQIRRERGQPPFPPHPYKLWKQERERRVTNILDPSHHVPPLRERLQGRIARIRELFRKEQPAGERTPLLL